MLLRGRIPLASLIQTLAVAEHLNFRHAASAFGVSQSSVSARVKTLEHDLGIFLFEHHARGVRLTEAGRHFVERVAAGVDQLDHAVKTAGMAAQGRCGRLSIGVHALIPRSFLAELIGQYRENHPCIGELSADREVIAYCLGPYCVLSFETVSALRARGYLVRRLEDGYPEWKAAGLPVEAVA